jgi:purine-binding chemotaxis protein CheW
VGFPVLVFRLARERYAIKLEEVSEALPFARCARAPGSPPEFRGVMNLRGELRAVLDLATLLALSENGDRDSGFVLMLRRPGREIGLKVDRIEELREIRTEELSVSTAGNYVKAIASGALMLLNVEAVLAAVFSAEES